MNFKIYKIYYKIFTKIFKILKKIFRKFINFVYIILNQNLYTIIIDINNK